MMPNYPRTRLSDSIQAQSQIDIAIQIYNLVFTETYMLMSGTFLNDDVFFGSSKSLDILMTKPMQVISSS